MIAIPNRPNTAAKNFNRAEAFHAIAAIRNYHWEVERMLTSIMQALSDEGDTRNELNDREVAFRVGRVARFYTR